VHCKWQIVPLNDHLSVSSLLKIIPSRPYFRVPVILQPKCFPPPAADSRPALKSRREVPGDDDNWLDLEDADWDKSTSGAASDCSTGGQLPDLSLAALRRLPELLHLLSREPFSPHLGKEKNKKCQEIIFLTWRTGDMCKKNIHNRPLIWRFQTYILNFTCAGVYLFFQN
jgi:hypothetical protein